MVYRQRGTTSFFRMRPINIDIRPNNMSKAFNISASRRGFSLAEVLAALTIGSMVLVTVLVIYGRVETVAAGITRKLESSQLPFEVLQYIAEDLDRIVEGDSDIKVTVENKFKEGYSSAKLTILKTYNDIKNKPQTSEEIIWQTDYDYESDANGLVLYRSYDGIGLEDKLLDEQRASWEEAYPFVPICEGVTFFKIEIPRGENALNKWTHSSLPYGITVTISFAEPFETLDGTFDVPDAEKVARTIAIGRTRKIGFTFPKKEYDSEEVSEDKEEEEGEDEEEIGEDEEEIGEDEEEIGEDAGETGKDKYEEDEENKAEKGDVEQGSKRR
jgi:prepilin-type N-terminal cleavage/methylation domain-containing protein